MEEEGWQNRSGGQREQQGREQQVQEIRSDLGLRFSIRCHPV